METFLSKFSCLVCQFAEIIVLHYKSVSFFLGIMKLKYSLSSKVSAYKTSGIWKPISWCSSVIDADSTFASQNKAHSNLAHRDGGSQLVPGDVTGYTFSSSLVESKRRFSLLTIQT